jgi:chlorite dismutase
MSHPQQTQQKPATGGSASAGGRPTPPPRPDIAEQGAPKMGRPQRMDRRLFMQLLAFQGCRDARPLIEALEAADHQGALYEDLNHPRGVALLSFTEDPMWFAQTVRRLVNAGPFAELEPRPELSMLGRTYALGYEANLKETLFHRPIRNVLNPEHAWAVWYPLRRRGSFHQLLPSEQRKILGEHGTIGRAFGEADYAHDVRLACQGLDQSDNDFVIGLLGRRLHPLSAIVQAMRGTVQTAQYLEKLGPFFVGRALRQSPMPEPEPSEEPE